MGGVRGRPDPAAQPHDRFPLPTPPDGPRQLITECRRRFSAESWFVMRKASRRMPAPVCASSGLVLLLAVLPPETAQARPPRIPDRSAPLSATASCVAAPTTL